MDWVLGETTKQGLDLAEHAEIAETKLFSNLRKPNTQPLRSLRTLREISELVFLAEPAEIADSEHRTLNTTPNFLRSARVCENNSPDPGLLFIR